MSFLTLETMKLFGSTESKISKDNNGENMPHLEITEVLLFRCSIVNSDCQHDSRVLYTFVPKKALGSSLEISAANHIHLKTFKSEFPSVRV